MRVLYKLLREIRKNSFKNLKNKSKKSFDLYVQSWDNELVERITKKIKGGI